MSKDLSSKELQNKFIEKLKSSGLSTREAKKLRFSLFSRSQAKSLLVPAYTGFKIPYFNVDGKPTKFYRVRYLEKTKTGFNAQTEGKELRYAQPPSTLNEVYLPPLIDWADFATDKSKPIVITEGELKAARATLSGFPTIGLGGVWCFRSSKKNLGLLPIFKEFSLEGRAIYIIFDSDAARNPNVILAANTLARELVALGAVPYILYLPDLEGLNKVGLDDYLLDQGKDALYGLIKKAEPFKLAEELHKLNEEVVYIKDPGFILVHYDMRRVSPRAFVDHAYSTRCYKQEVLKPDGGSKLIEVCAPKEWLKWPQRAEVEKVAYEPGAPRITESKCLNMWTGWNVEPRKGDIAPWKTLLDFLFDGEPEARRYYEQWCAYPLQNPGVKMFTACVLWGRAQGTGKTLVGYTLMKIYGNNSIEINDEDLSKGDNDYAENKQFAVGEEITGGDKRGVADRLKSLITRRTVRINVKYVPRYTTNDCINYYFTSQHPDAFFLEDLDRRFFIQEVKGQPLSKEFYEAYDKWYGGSSEKPGPGIPALFDHLLNLDLTGFNPRAPAPMTDSKLEMIDDGRSALGEWVHRLKQDPDSVLRIGSTINSNKLWRSEDLLKFYDPENKNRVTVIGIAKELKRAGFVKPNGNVPCHTKLHGQLKLWAIRDIAAICKMSGTELGQYYDKERELELPVEKVEKFKQRRKG